MIITEIKKIGQGKRYSLYVDEEFVGVFEAEILAKNKSKTGQELSSDELQRLKIENGDYASFDRALSVLEKGMKTEKGVRDFLLQKGYPEECVARSIEKLKEYGYINDEFFAESYIKTYSSNKGKKKIKYELINKGVDKQIIDEKLNDLIEEEEEFEVCKTMAKKYLRNKVIDGKTRNKLSNHLASKGFGYDIISKVVREVFVEVEDESWD